MCSTESCNKTQLSGGTNHGTLILSRVTIDTGPDYLLGTGVTLASGNKNLGRPTMTLNNAFAVPTNMARN